MAANSIHSPGSGMYASLIAGRTQPGNNVPKMEKSAARPVSHSFSYREGKAEVHEIHYEVEKGTNSNLIGSYSYRTESMKAGRLKTRIAVEKGKLRDAETKTAKKTKGGARERDKIKGRVKKLERQLSDEIASSPVTRVVVHEKMEEKGAEEKSYDLRLSSEEDTRPSEEELREAVLVEQA